MSLASAKYGANIKLDTRDVKRFEENLKKFDKLTVKKRRKYMEQACKFALGATKKEMKKNAGRIKKTGKLENSIESSAIKRTGYGSVAGARTGPIIRGKGKRRAFHAHLVELGTKKKLKTTKKQGSNFSFFGTKVGRWIKTNKINHGSMAQPFIEPAWQATKDKVRKRMRDKMKKILDDVRKEFSE